MRRMAAPAAAKQVRMAPHTASETMPRRDQMLLPLSASGMPGFPPGMLLLSASSPPKCLARAPGSVKQPPGACDGSSHLTGFIAGARKDSHGASRQFLGDRFGAGQHPHRLHAGAGRLLHLLGLR